jgi:histidinol-phosphate/aromatic aminotransferase/cobyric acid decarboxylase-like protein
MILIKNGAARPVSNSAMASAPLHIPQSHRQLLAEFERRYQSWRTVSAAAEAAQRALAPGAESRQVLDLQAEAARLQQQAVQLLRDQPL